jgi:hypothetical protein
MANAVFFLIIALTDWDWKKRIESLRFKNPDFELLVLGSSLTQYDVDTEFLTSQGLKSYNFALVGNTVRGSYIQLEEYLSRYSNKPECVILAVNSYLEKLDGDKIQDIVKLSMKDHKYTLKDFPLLKFTNWFGGEILKKILSRKHRQTEVSYGQIKREKIRPDTSKFSPKHLDLNKFKSSHWISEIVKLCHQEGIGIIIVELPAVNETQNVSEVGPCILKYDNKYSAILYNLNSRDFCTFIDPARDWVGDSHFNPGGARKFTEKLLDILENDRCLQEIDSLTCP